MTPSNNKNKETQGKGTGPRAFLANLRHNIGMRLGANVRALQDHSISGRGDIANKEQGIGKSHGKSYSRGKKKAKISE